VREKGKRWEGVRRCDKESGFEREETGEALGRGAEQREIEAGWGEKTSDTWASRALG
jgi:hypothetical protein